MTLHPVTLSSSSNVMEEVVEIRRYLHRNPEIGLSEFKTSDFVAGRLAEMGYEVTRGLAGTGVVATLRTARATAASASAPTSMPYQSMRKPTRTMQAKPPA